jgi:hypothetical protein
MTASLAFDETQSCARSETAASAPASELLWCFYGKFVEMVAL